MKAELKATGQLVLTPESGVEAYALMKWTSEAEQPPAPGRARAVMINLEQFPETLPTESRLPDDERVMCEEEKPRPRKQARLSPEEWQRSWMQAKP